MRTLKSWLTALALAIGLVALTAPTHAAAPWHRADIKSTLSAFHPMSTISWLAAPPGGSTPQHGRSASNPDMQGIAAAYNRA